MVFELLGTPAQFILDPSKRVYWVYLLSALTIASLAVSYQEGRFRPLKQLKSLFNSAYWFSRSSLVDFALMFFNSIMRLSLLIPTFGSHIAVTVLVGGFLQTHLGDAPHIDLPWYWIAIIFSTVLLLADDLSRFVLHFSMHRFDLLWSFHKTHHSATVLTPFTVFRVHPVESMLYFFRSLLVFGLVTGVFVWLFSQHLTGLKILGVDMFGFLFNFAAANLRHSPIWLSFGRLEHFFISPAQHQLHHSVDHPNVNFGSVLSIWDAVVGTRFFASEKVKLRFGITETQDEEHPQSTDKPVVI